MNSPFKDYLSEYLKSKPMPFHTPGHKGKLVLQTILDSSDIVAADIPDDICGFPGVKTESEDEASKFFKSKKTFYLVNGSTSGVIAMIAGTIKPGEKIIIARNLHHSVISALVISGAVPVYIPICSDEGGIPLNVRSEDVEKAVNMNPDAKAVLITSPSYYGVCANISAIADIVHKSGKPLLVDEAWGAHLYFGSGLPASARDCGADISVEGAHKTLPSLTGTAVLNIWSDRVDVRQIERALTLVETSSPNMLFYLSIENALTLMEREGGLLLTSADESVRQAVEVFKDNGLGLKTGLLSETVSYKDEFEFDPLKLLIRTNYDGTGITGYMLAQALISSHSIIPEMADINSVLFIFTGFENNDAGVRLASAICKEYKTLLDQVKIKTILENNNIATFSSVPKVVASPRDVFFFESELVPLEKSEGMTVKTMVVPYPPGIPLLIPGEVITRELIEYQEKLIEFGAALRGINFVKGKPFIEVQKNNLNS